MPKKILSQPPSPATEKPAAAATEKTTKRQEQLERSITLSVSQYDQLFGIWYSFSGAMSLLKDTDSSHETYHALRPILDEFNALFEDLPIVEKGGTT